MNGFSRYLLSTLLLVLAGIASAEIETVTWLHTDHLGSPLMARDAQGNTLWQEDYSPWGERLAAPSANSAVTTDSSFSNGCSPTSFKRTLPARSTNNVVG